jgi:hypothetical protein
MDKKIIATSILIAMLFVSAIAGTIVYYNNIIANLNNQVSTQIENLTSANLTSELTITEIPWPNHFLNGTLIPDYYPHGFSNLFINGSVTNQGEGIAFNAGLHVSAYTNNDTLAANMTVPLVSGGWVHGTDATTNAYVSNYYKDYLGTFQLGYFKSGQTVTFDLSFYHEGTVSNWSITPVWTNSP